MATQSAQVKAFVVDALEAVEFKLVREAKTFIDVESFHPVMAHQIFGQEESIFGYKDLKVQLYYAAGPLDVFFNTEYSKRVSFRTNFIAKRKKIGIKFFFFVFTFRLTT